MDQGPVVSEQINAGARFLAEFQKYAPIQTAFWLKDSEEPTRYLYVASEQINDENIGDGYDEVIRIAQALQDPGLDLFKVKLIGADHPRAKAALDLRRRYPGQTPVRVFDRIFGGMSVEEVYIYPTPLPVAA